MFIDKEEILLSTFIVERTRKDKRNDVSIGWKNKYPSIYKYQFEHYIMSITLYYTGPEVKFLKEDDIDMGNLPDSDDGAVIVYYNIDEAIELIEKKLDSLKKKKSEN